MTDKPARPETTDIVMLLRQHGGGPMERAADEIERLRSLVVTFCAPFAGEYAAMHMHELPRGHLHPTHYDILKECGARMDDFTRAEIVK